MTGDSEKTDTGQVISINRKYNDNIRDGRRSIIEEWKNPPIRVEDILRSDQLYEERAIDVGFDYHPRQSQQTPIDVENNKENVVKIKRPQGGGTVRSIPIKDYQASLAHNVGTLRRSVVPQTQFESLVSEPEKIVYTSTKHRRSLANDLSFIRQPNKHATLSAASRSKEIPVSIETRDPPCKACNHYHYIIQADSRNRNATANINSNFNNYNESYDVADWDQYFRRSSSRKLDCNHRGIRDSKRQSEFSRDNTESTKYNRLENTEGDSTKRCSATDAECSNVGQKIFVYEENARRAKFHRDSRRRSLSDMRRHRTIGVPLVGMHNACGLPVVASWHDPDILEPLRVTSKIVGTLGPVYKGPRVYSTARRRMHPKGRAPQPDRACRIRTKVRKASVSGEAIEKSSRKKSRRPSFKTARAGTLSAKSSFKRTCKVERRSKRGSTLDSFGTKSLKEDTSKRATLYAKDDGEEAVEVLKSLCLNPLARTRPETDMMW